MKITPKLPKPKQDTVDYADLENGDTFLYQGNACIKSDIDCEQRAVDLTDGDFYDDMCDQQVIPINAELKWSYKAKKGKSK